MMQVAFTIAMFVTIGLLVYVAFLAMTGDDDLSFGTHSDQADDEHDTGHMDDDPMPGGGDPYYSDDAYYR